MKIAKIFAWFFGPVAMIAIIAQESRASVTEEALQLELDSDGLSALAQVIHEEMFTNVQEVMVPDLERYMFGVGLILKAMNLRFFVDSINLGAPDNVLELALGIRQMSFAVDSFQVKSKLFGKEFQQTCHNTQFLIARQQPVILRTKLDATVQDRKVILAERETSFPIEYDDYTVKGPLHCDGPNGATTSLILNRVFTAARPLIVNLVRYQVQTFLPLIAEQLTAHANFSMPIDLTRFWQIPVQTLVLATYPNSVILGQGSLQITMAASFASDQSERRSEHRSEYSVVPRASIPRLASLGFNPELFTQAMTEVFPQGTPWLEIDESFYPGLRNFLTVENLSLLWPELKALNTEEPYARLKVLLGSPPRLRLDPASQAITLEESDLALKFIVKTEGAWQDYARLDLDIRTGVIPQLKDETFSLGLMADSRVQVRTVLADESKPMAPIFDQSAAEALIQTLLDGSRHRGPLMSLVVPPWSIRGRLMTLGEVTVAKSLIKIGFNSVIASP